MAFTTLDELKERLELLDKGVDEDDLLTDLLDQANSYIVSIIGRPLTNQSHTELCSGGGGRFLLLSNGPVQAVHGVTEISWQSQGVTSSETAVTDYLIHGDETWWKLSGFLERITGDWSVGRQNYRVSYSAGFSTIPDDLKFAELFAATFFYNKRKNTGTFTRNIGTGNVNYRGELELRRDLMQYLSPYMPISPSTQISVGLRRLG